jgi:precorrin-6Y C5,15-methyltransferase (decarboxylating)
MAAAESSSPEPGRLLCSLVPAPDAIEPLSMSRIADAALDIPWTGIEREMALRIAYAVGDASVLSDFACSNGAVQIGVDALTRGAPLIADVRMVVTGIDKRRARQLGIEIRTRIDDSEVAALAGQRGITRSAQAMLSQASQLNGAVVAIGNAPTALLALLDMIDAGVTRPALILGFPVGYVAAAESKAELERRDVPFITMRGPRGGTPMAVSAANTLLRLATKDLPAGVPRSEAPQAAASQAAAPQAETRQAAASQRVMLPDAEPPATAGGQPTQIVVEPQATTSDGRIRIIGVGDDGLAGLGEQARATLAAARTIYGGTRQLEMVPDTAARKVNLSTGYRDALDELTSGTRADGAVVLASGDPMLFGIGSTLARHFGAGTPDRIEVMPHPSSVQVALSRLGEPSDNVAVLSALARPLRPVLAAAMPLRRFAVLLDPKHDAPTVARALLDAGMEDANATVCERLEGAGERIVRGALGSIAATPSFDPLSLLVVLRSPDEVARYRRAAIPDTEFAHRDGQITKADVRALAVAALRLRPSDTLWDVGAGSGSVGIEAALTMPRGAVYAVDQSVEQIGFIRTNAVRFRTPQVEPVYGSAPEVFIDLPVPDAAFVGGGGARLIAIVEAVIARLQPGGRIVVTLATLERVGPLLETLRLWQPELRQIAISHGVPLADGTRLQPANPILMVAATKPAPEA